MRDALSIRDESVILDSDVVAEVVGDRGQDLLPPLSTLRAGGMVHHVFGDEFIDDGIVTSCSSPEQFFHD